MLIKSSTEESSCTVGTRHARPLSGRHRTRKTVPSLAQNSAILPPTLAEKAQHWVDSNIISRQSFLVWFGGIIAEENCPGAVGVRVGIWVVPGGEGNAICCSIFVPVVVITVRALYAGTLVTCWTTALCPRCRYSSALLAAICFIVVTLTITSRCYAFSNATHQLVQFTPAPVVQSM